MIIVQINTGIGFGSIGRIADQIGNLVETEGGKCYYVHGSRYIAHTSPTAIQVGEKWEDYLHYTISLLTGRDGIGSVRATRSLTKKLDDIKPDIVHLHNIHGFYINYRILFEYLSKQNIPVVWTFHDCWPITGHCPYFDSVNCFKWKTQCHKCPLKKEFPKSLFFDQSQKNFLEKKKSFTSVQNLTVVPVSNWLGGIVQESFLRDATIKVIHNGIDISIFKPTPSDLREQLKIPKDKKIVLGVASGWDNRKGFYDFIELSKNLQWQIIMVGNVDKTVDESLLPESIIHIKNTNSQKELAEYYTLADVFINPTYSDNFPTTNIEALACGTPVITYRTGGSPEAIDDSCGMVIKQGDVESLASSIMKLIEQPLSKEACRRRAELYFDKNKCFREYLSLYNSILGM